MMKHRKQLVAWCLESVCPFILKMLDYNIFLSTILAFDTPFITSLKSMMPIRTTYMYTLYKPVSYESRRIRSILRKKSMYNPLFYRVKAHIPKIYLNITILFCKQILLSLWSYSSNKLNLKSSTQYYWLSKSIQKQIYTKVRIC